MAEKLSGTLPKEQGPQDIAAREILTLNADHKIKDAVAGIAQWSLDDRWSQGLSADMANKVDPSKKPGTDFAETGDGSKIGIEIVSILDRALANAPTKERLHKIKDPIHAMIANDEFHAPAQIQQRIEDLTNLPPQEVKRLADDIHYNRNSPISNDTSEVTLEKAIQGSVDSVISQSRPPRQR